MPERSGTEQPTIADPPLRAELYLRGDVHGVFDAQQQVVNRVERLAANGAFSDSIVAGRWERCRTRPEEWRSGALETYEEFRSWAERNGFSLAPAFQRRTRTFVGMDDVEEVVVFPAVALAIYEADELEAVFPCTDQDRVYTVEDALEAFERGDEEWLTTFDSVAVERTEARVEPGDMTAD